MHYVYILRSMKWPEKRYVGFTEDLKTRFAAHNSGNSPHTARYKPWELVGYMAFQTAEKAMDFEKYLKTGAGRAFAAKRFI